MPKLPDALGTPDPNGFSPTDAAAQAGSGSAPDPAQSHYGVVAAAAGYTLDQVLRAAGMANLLGRGTSRTATITRGTSR